MGAQQSGVGGRTALPPRRHQPRISRFRSHAPLVSVLERYAHSRCRLRPTASRPSCFRYWNKLGRMGKLYRRTQGWMLPHGGLLAHRPVGSHICDWSVKAISGADAIWELVRAEDESRFLSLGSDHITPVQMFSTHDP